MNFDLAFDRLINHEGAYSSEFKDPGNWTGGRVNVGELKGTKFGIAANTYGDIDIKNLTIEQAKAIYYRDWWLKIGADEIPSPVVYQMWDFAVNAGMGKAREAIQYAAGVAQDGRIGPMTIAAIKRAELNDLLLKFNAYRIRHYTSLSTWATFGKCWAIRVAGQLVYASMDN